MDITAEIRQNNVEKQGYNRQTVWRRQGSGWKPAAFADINSGGFRRFQRVSNADAGFKFQVSDGFKKNKTRKTSKTFFDHELNELNEFSLGFF